MLDFLIMYESKNRELEGDILLGTELKHRGYNVGYIHSHYFKGKKIETKVLIMPYAYNNLTLYHHAYRICGRQQKIISLRSEQILANKYESDYGSWGYPKEEAQKIYTVSWGKNETESLLHCGIANEKILEVGNINVDMLYDEKLFIGKERLGKKYNILSDNEWILFISSFSLVGMSHEEEEGMLQRVGEEAKDFFKISKESRAEILSWFENYLNENQYKEIIYRRHPAEGMDNVLSNMEEKYNNFHVIYEEPVYEWIYAADRVYNWYSTSAFQTIILGKENILLRPTDFLQCEDINMFMNDRHITTYSEFSQDKSEKITDKSGYENYFIFKEGAYQRLADSCEQIIHNDQADCRINYDAICKTISMKQSIINAINYQIVFPYYRLMMKRGLDVPSFISSGYSEYKRICNCICCEAEFKSIERKVKKYLSKRNAVNE